MERFKRKLIAGIIYFGIGIAFILWGVYIWITAPWWSWDRLWSAFLWFISGIFFIAAVGLLIHSAVLKKRMEKLEKIVEKEEMIGTKMEVSWEISPDCKGIYEKIASTDPLGNLIITSKCKLEEKTGSFLVSNLGNGFLIASDNGLAWKKRVGVDITGISYISGKKWRSKWIRWHDVANIVPIKPVKKGQIWVHIKKRKGGALILDKKGNYNLIKWKLTLNRNKAEAGSHFIQRRANFGNIMLDTFKQKQVEIDPPSSDSRM